MRNSAMLSFADPEQYQASIRAADVQILPTTKGDFHAELIQVNLRQLWIQRGRENLARIMFGATNADRAIIGFLTHSEQPAVQHCGIEVLPGDIIVNDSKSMHRRTHAACNWGSMSLEREVLAAVSKSLCGRELTVPSVTHIVRPESALMNRLLVLHERICGFVRESSTPTAVMQALESEIIHLMVRCLDQGQSVVMSTTGRHHSRIIARFEEFLAENILQPVYLSEISTATGASERTLRKCCNDYLGMGPVRYLWLRRMYLARRALLLATPRAATVAQTAMDHGFWELGRFSTQYHSLFGESPSATLRRQPDPGTPKHLPKLHRPR
jgi:AraC-like DNA-binding protein